MEQVEAAARRSCSASLLLLGLAAVGGAGWAVGWWSAVGGAVAGLLALGGLGFGLYGVLLGITRRMGESQVLVTGQRDAAPEAPPVPDDDRAAGSSRLPPPEDETAGE